MPTLTERHVTVPATDATLEAELAVPPGATGVVALATTTRVDWPHPDALVAALRDRGLGTLLVCLLTDRERRVPHAGFDVSLLTDRLTATAEWVRGREETAGLPLCCVGSSTAAAAVLSAAARLGDDVAAIVSWGGRTDLATGSLSGVRAPTLFVVDRPGAASADLVRTARARLPGPAEILAADGTDSGVTEAPVDRTATWVATRLS